MKVVPIGGKRDREEMVRHLQQLIARVATGQVTALATAWKDSSNAEGTQVMGEYRDQPASGLRAAMRLSMELTRREAR